MMHNLTFLHQEIMVGVRLYFVIGILIGMTAVVCGMSTLKRTIYSMLQPPLFVVLLAMMRTLTESMKKYSLNLITYTQFQDIVTEFCFYGGAITLAMVSILGLLIIAIIRGREEA